MLISPRRIGRLVPVALGFALALVYVAYEVTPLVGGSGVVGTVIAFVVCATGVIVCRRAVALIRLRVGQLLVEPTDLGQLAREVKKYVGINGGRGLPQETRSFLRELVLSSAEREAQRAYQVGPKLDREELERVRAAVRKRMNTAHARLDPPGSDGDAVDR